MKTHTIKWRDAAKTVGVCKLTPSFMALLRTAQHSQAVRLTVLSLAADLNHIPNVEIMFEAKQNDEISTIIDTVAAKYDRACPSAIFHGILALCANGCENAVPTRNTVDLFNALNVALPKLQTLEMP